MEQEVLKILSSGKSLGRYEKVLYLLNNDCGEYEEQPHRKKQFLGWGYISKNVSVLIAQKEGFAGGYMRN